MGGSSMNEWKDEQDWLEHARQMQPPDEFRVSQGLVAWADDRGLKHRGQGNWADSKGVSYMPVIPKIDWDPVALNATAATGRVVIEGSSIAGQGRRPYGTPGAFERLLERARSIPGVSQTKDTYPDISMKALTDEDVFDQFIGLVDEIVRQIRKRNLGDLV